MEKNARSSADKSKASAGQPTALTLVTLDDPVAGTSLRANHVFTGAYMPPLQRVRFSLEMQRGPK